MRQADCLPLVLKLPQPFTEPRLLPVYGADFLQQPTVGIVEALQNRRQYAHIIAQAANLARQPLQGLSDIGEVATSGLPALSLNTRSPFEGRRRPI